MGDFLITFNSKQFSAQYDRTIDPKPCVLATDLARRTEHTIKHIRTKKLKKYEKIFEEVGLKKHMTDPENEFMGLENIASETLVRLSQHCPAFPSRSIKTTQEQTRPKTIPDIRVSESFVSVKKNEFMLRKIHLTPKETTTGDTSLENKFAGDRKRCLSLKDTPLISYPSDQRKLPKVFRCKSIHHSDSAQKETTPEKSRA